MLVPIASRTIAPPCRFHHRRARQLIHAVLGVLIALLAAGCIQYEEQITFSPDGSGTMRISQGFDMTLLAELGETESGTT